MKNSFITLKMKEFFKSFKKRNFIFWIIHYIIIITIIIIIFFFFDRKSLNLIKIETEVESKQNKLFTIEFLNTFFKNLLNEFFKEKKSNK